MPNSWDIEAALIAKLQGDAQLKTLLPDGVFYGIAPPGAKRFVIVSLTDPVDIGHFGGTAIESNLYLVKGVGLSSLLTIAQSKAAADRIHQLLHDQTLTVAGYDFVDMVRHDQESRVRYPEPVEGDPSLQWLHGGGFYRVRVAVRTA